MIEIVDCGRPQGIRPLARRDYLVKIIMNTLIFVVYTVLVTYASVRPMDGGPLEPWDKVGHLAVYFLFALLGSRVARSQRHFLYLCAGIVIYGGLMEVVQSFLPGRVMSVYDVLANTLGVIVGAAIAKSLLRDKAIR